MSSDEGIDGILCLPRNCGFNAHAICADAGSAHAMACACQRKKFSHCIEAGLECTFGGAASKYSYVDAQEAVFVQGKRFCRAQHYRCKFHHYGGRESGCNRSSDSFIAKHQSASPGPVVKLAALTIHSMNTPAPAPHGDDLAHLALTQAMSDLSLHQHHEGFRSKFSGAMLVKAAIDRGPRGACTIGPLIRHPHVGPSVFPEPDLLSELIALYFEHVNPYYPLLHRPTFERSVADGLHTRDASFGAVVLPVSAIASRFSDDVRPPHVIDHLFVRLALHHMQYCWCLAVLFLEYVTPSACWTWIRIGIRMAQDLWKCAFWLLVCLERYICTVLGRPCTTQYEDFDAELLIECDDEFWENADPVRTFKQPVGKPSRIILFNCLIRRNNIQAFSLKMLSGSNKTKDLLAGARPCVEEHVVAELDSALNGWVDSIPSHRRANSNMLVPAVVRWDPNRPDDAFFDQSALLYCTYYQLQMTIHEYFAEDVDWEDFMRRQFHAIHFHQS
ncbi:hypothetical protein C8R44DRAFT_880780 [Mycena epipterygia]|nr:hypothetical protein C8R44DRAFT_880780 [Mycena epipterygia]